MANLRKRKKKTNQTSNVVEAKWSIKGKLCSSSVEANRSERGGDDDDDEYKDETEDETEGWFWMVLWKKNEGGKDNSSVN